MAVVFPININWCRCLLLWLALVSATFAASAQAQATQPAYEQAVSVAQQLQPAQQPPPAQQSGGSSTGGAHAAVLDSEHRPITAGGFVKSGPIVFKDIAAKAGLRPDA